MTINKLVDSLRSYTFSARLVPTFTEAANELERLSELVEQQNKRIKELEETLDIYKHIAQ